MVWNAHIAAVQGYFLIQRFKNLAAAESALWARDGFGVGEVRGRFVAHGQGFGLPGRWRTKAVRAVPGGHEVDAMREGAGRQYPLGGVQTATEVADVMAWLLGPQSSRLTGQVIAVDGGFTQIRPLVK